MDLAVPKSAENEDRILYRLVHHFLFQLQTTFEVVQTLLEIVLFIIVVGIQSCKIEHKQSQCIWILLVLYDQFELRLLYLWLWCWQFASLDESVLELVEILDVFCLGWASQ